MKVQAVQDAWEKLSGFIRTESEEAIFRFMYRGHLADKQVPYEKTFMFLKSDERFEKQVQAMTAYLEKEKIFHEPEKRANYDAIIEEVKVARTRFLELDRKVYR